MVLPGQVPRYLSAALGQVTYRLIDIHKVVVLLVLAPRQLAPCLTIHADCCSQYTIWLAARTSKKLRVGMF